MHDIDYSFNHYYLLLTVVVVVLVRVQIIQKMHSDLQRDAIGCVVDERRTSTEFLL